MKIAAIIFGIVFLLLGIAGFTGMASEGSVFGLEVGAVHNVVHLLTGIIALWVAFVGVGAVRKFFKIFGVIYLIVAILGFFTDGKILGLIENNSADAWFHLIVAVLALVLGFSSKKASVPAMTQPAAAPMQQPPMGGPQDQQGQ
ncbi:MAG: DUF4383 domain-containing protein [Candidatus Harrisonbacteria bacterium]|nr:DUF4383 domain-containing protein [Candidatus Harrisonbacteria bacterium]